MKKNKPYIEHGGGMAVIRLHNRRAIIRPANDDSNAYMLEFFNYRPGKEHLPSTIHEYHRGVSFNAIKLTKEVLKGIAIAVALLEKEKPL